MSTATAPRAVNTSDLSFSRVRDPAEIAVLQVDPGQIEWFAPTGEIIAELAAKPDRIAMAIRAGEELVGFFIIGRDLRDRSAWWLRWFMLDHRQQGKGYGRSAMRGILALLARREGCRQIRLQVTPGNDVARRLYVRNGFRDTGRMADDGDDILVLVVMRSVIALVSALRGAGTDGITDLRRAGSRHLAHAGGWHSSAPAQRTGPPPPCP